MLGFANQITTNEQIMGERENCEIDPENTGCVPLTDEELVYLVDYIIIERDGAVEANLPPILGRINKIFV